MNSGQASLEELLRQLRTIDVVAFRLALHLENKEWKIHTLVIESFPKHTDQDIPFFDYQYSTARFIAGTASGEDAALWLAKREISTHLLESHKQEYNLSLPMVSDRVSWTKYPSHTINDYTSTPWPYNRYDVTSTVMNSSYDDTFQLADGCPFFPNFKAAVLQLIYGYKSWQQEPNPSADPRAIVRIARTDAWLRHITLSATTLKIDIAGENLDKVRLVISAVPNFETSKPIQELGTVECILPEGIPSLLWIILARDNEWLDCYHRNRQYHAVFTREQANVTVEQDYFKAETEISALIYQGEGVNTEFKGKIPENHDQMLKTVAAFANGSGGVILLGVQDRTGELIGIGSDVAGEKDRIINMVRSRVIPEPVLDFQNAEIEYRQILAIYVKQGDRPPYGLDPDPMKTRYYVRRGANSFPARPEEIRAMVLAHQIQQQPLPPYAPYNIPSQDLFS